MSKEYEELKELLLKQPELKDKVEQIDADPDLTEDEKYATLSVYALELVIHNQQ